jgi:uncharacterized repeat protein (TIGR03803 family)
VRGKLYGTTYEGGDSPCDGSGCGTVYSISKNGKENVLYSFSFYYPSGGYVGANLLDVKGTLYGTTSLGGAESGVGYGTVFSVSTTGTQKLLYAFDGTNGSQPQAGLIIVNGTLYGTTTGGGASGDWAGTAFSITTSGSLTTLDTFGSGSDGASPYAPLLNVRGTLYGTTVGGGTYDKGTVFRMSLTGTDEKVIHDFGYGSDGATPLGGLIDVKGTLYGTTSAGGTYGDGTVFALTP